MAFDHMIRSRAATAFTLIELLVVTAIMLILVSMASLGLAQVMEGARMTQAGRSIVDEINLARQIAATRNVNVELRFMEQTRAGTNVFCGLQSGVRNKAGDGTFVPVTRLTLLPDGVALAPQASLSSLIGSLTKSTATNPAYRYVAVIIRPSGSLEPASGLSLNQPWFVTAVPETKLGVDIAALKNFVTVQIDPWTARPTAYRP